MQYSVLLRFVSDTVCPVADKELVEETQCGEETGEEDCREVNNRFMERCLKYRNCPRDDEDPVFVCQQKQCVSRYVRDLTEIGALLSPTCILHCQ